VLPPDAIAATGDGELRDLSFVPRRCDRSKPCGVGRRRSPRAAPLDRPRDGTGVCDLHPGAKYAIGPAIEDGFYYDIELPAPLSSDDLPRSRPGCVSWSRPTVPFVREEVARAMRWSASPTSRTSARSSRASTTRSREVGGGDRHVYRNGGWADLCLGPHVPSTGRLGAFR
jgi:threonyl-tRNA synthetase